VSYGIGDASGNGYGTAMYLKDSIIYRYGQWASEVSEAFSNYTELKNLVNMVENYVKKDVCKIVN